MKIITAKEFQQNHSAVLKDVAAGQEYQVTFHRRPVVKLTPMHKPAAVKPRRGSYEALIEALQHASSGKGDIMTLSYKELRGLALKEKHGR